MEKKKENFNTEQQSAVDFYGKDLLVSASAGSGKTKVIIGKIMDIIVNKKIPVNRLLITTFTLAASNQMQAKLAKSLSSEIIETNDLETKKFLLEQLEDLPNATIGTLHSFCQSLIKKYFYAIHLEPGIALIDERDSNFFKNQALDEVFENYAINKEESFNELVEIFNENRDLTVVKKILIDLLNFVKSKSDYFDFLLKAQSALFKDNEIVYKFCNEYLCFYSQNVYRQFYDFYIQANQLQSEKLIKVCKEYLNQIENVNLNNSFEKNIEYLMYKPKYPILNKKGLDGNELILLEEISEFKKEFMQKDFKPSIFGITSLEELNSENISQSFVDTLIEVLKDFDIAYKKLKSQKNVLDFNDLEEYTLQLLKNENILDDIKNSYDYLFVDEYQDTNEVQEKIIKCCSKGDNVIMVGDVKQSIYGFRNSSPKNFLEKYDTFTERENLGKVIDLNMNYRSQKVILDFSNFIFEKIMNKTTCEIDYKNTSSFKCGKSFVDNNAKVEIHIINSEKQEKEQKLLENFDISNFEEENSKDNYQINLLLKLIKEKLNTEIFDEEISQSRKVQYKDIAILCRKNEDRANIAKVFQNLKIPFTTKFKVKLFKEYEIGLLLDYLSLIENDYNDVALVGCLKSPIGNLTNNDLMKIKLNTNEKTNFYVAVNSYRKLDDEIAKKLNVFYEKLNKFKQIKDYYYLREFVELIIEEFSLNAYFVSFNEGNLKLKNISIFLKLLENKFYNRNLTAFLKFVNDFANDESFDIEENGGENSICIDTIHSSKGLEYNIVFLFATEKKYGIKETTGELLKNKELGISIKEINKENFEEKNSITRNLFKLLAKQNQVKEEMRLLYVALTRAKNSLFILGRADIDKIKSLNNDLSILKANSYLKLLLGVLSPTQLEILKNGALTVSTDDTTCKYNLHTEQELENFLFNESGNKILDINFDEITKVYNFKYPFVLDTCLRLKNSVTGLTEENYNITDFKTTTFDNLDEDFLTIGNAYHKIMELSKLDKSNLEKLKLLKEFETVGEEKIIKAIENLTKIKGDRQVFCEQNFMLYAPKKIFDNSFNSNAKVLVQGIVDLILMGENDIILVDYKTSRLTREKLKEKYKLQLDLYAVACEKYFKKPVSKKIIYSFELDDIVEI